MAQHACRIPARAGLAHFYDRLDRIDTAGDAFECLRATAIDAGFRHITIVRFSLDCEEAIVRQIMFTSLPRSILRDFEQNSLANGSRAMAASRRSQRPFAWDRVTPHAQQAGNDNRGNRAVLARAGITMGITLPVASWRATRGLVVLGGDRANPDFDELARLSLVCNCIFDRLIELDDGQPGAGDFRLTLRERQCLTWTSAGKTSAEIAGILGLSEHTVNQYITSSGQKLGAVNRTQAVAKALRLRLID